MSTAAGEQPPSARLAPRADLGGVPPRDRWGPTLRSDPGLTDRRSWGEVLRLAAGLGLPFGTVPAALLLELAPQLGFLGPALGAFGGALLLFALLARAPHRALVWVTAAAFSGFLILGAVAATLWTLTRAIPGTG